MTRRWPVRAAWLLAVLVLAAGCGVDAGARDSGGITRATPVGAETAEATPVAPAGAAPASLERIDPAIGAWADAVCAVTARFDDAVVAVQDGIDPRTRSVPERLASAERRFGAYVEALREQARALDALTAPPAAQPYHAALRVQVSEFERLFVEQMRLLETAVIADDIEAANAELNREAERLENSLALVRSRLPVVVQSALASAGRCGGLLG